jgi:L-lactate dehydrogenase (cytochrome)
MFPGRLSNCLNVEDYRRAAKRRAHKMVFDYIDGGSDDEVARFEGQRAFQDYRIAHRVLSGVDKPDMSTTVLGQKIEVPFILSPAAGNRLFHTDGELGPAKAADNVGTVYCLSTLSSRSIEEIGDATGGPKWFQLYVWKDRVLVKEMLARAKKAGYSALVLTVDFPITGNRERDPRNGFTIPPKLGPKQVWHAIQAPLWSLDYVTKPNVKYANLSEDTSAVSLNEFVAKQLSADFSWDDAEWLLGEWNGPAMIKGVARPDDAVRAVKTGFGAISLSNHGGRQLDSSPAPIHCVQELRHAIGNDANVIVDGGVRRGTDVLKALALGADAVSFARPYLYGLAAFGVKGAVQAVTQLRDAVERDMILSGVGNVDALDESYIRVVK